MLGCCGYISINILFNYLLFQGFTSTNISAAEHFYSSQFVSAAAPDDPIKNIVDSALESLTTSCLLLASKSKKVEKYSVVAKNSSAEFVHLFQGNDNSWFIKCQSGICQHKCGKKRNLKSISKAEYLCCHMEMYRDSVEALLQKNSVVNTDVDDVPCDDDLPGRNNDDDDNDDDDNDGDCDNGDDNQNVQVSTVM